MLKKILQYLQDFFFIIYPRSCECCSNPLVHNENILCSKCLVEMPRSVYFDNEKNPILTLLAGRVPIKSAISLFSFTKDSNYRKLLHKLKYKNKPEIGILLGEELGAEMKKHEIFSQIDFIVPVPLHSRRQKWRGYNQSEKIADGISNITKIPVLTNNFIRNKETTTQTRKSKEERWQNVSGKFLIKDKDVLKNKHILIVDDVLTTGATIEACAEELLKIENLSLSIAVLAKV
jgi:ComF family protein